MKPKQNTLGVVALVGLSVGWGLSALVTRGVQLEMSPLQQITIQAWTAAALTALTWKLRGDRCIFKFPRKAVLNILLLRSILGIAGIGLCMYAVARIPLANVAWMGALPYAAVWGVLLHGDRLSAYEVGLILIAAVGTTLMVGYSPSVGLALELPELAALSGHVLFSLGLVLGRSAVEISGTKVAHLWSLILMTLLATPVMLIADGGIQASIGIFLAAIFGGFLWVWNGFLSLYGFTHVRAGGRI